MGAGRPREDREIIDGVVKEFLALCAVPHGSWREGTLADLLALPGPGVVCEPGRRR